MNEGFENWWNLNRGRYDCYVTTKKCSQDTWEARNLEVKKLKTQVKNLKIKLKDAVHSK